MHVADLEAYGFKDKPDSRPAQTGVIHSIFGGQTRSQVQCANIQCKFKSNKYDAFLDLSIQIQTTQSVVEALKAYTQEEVLDSSNMYTCSQCTSKTCATKRISIHRTPYVLQLHLKRFETTGGGHSTKIGKHIIFPMELPVQEFMSKGEENTASTLPYELYAVVVHEGNTQKGHYYAFVKNSQGVLSRCLVQNG